MCWRDQVVAAANRRPVITAAVVFFIASAVIAETAYLLWGYSTPPKECFTALLRAIAGI